MAAGEGREFRLARGSMGELGRRELSAAGARLSRELDKPFEPARNGDRIESVIAARRSRQRTACACQTIAGFNAGAMVQWCDVLERRVGKSASGIMQAPGIDWHLGVVALA
ncbi:MAG TPA: DUF3363 domain-containing protein [Sphingomicrobium sp.]